MKRYLLIIAIIIPVLCSGYDFINGGIRNAAMGSCGIGSSKDAAAAVWNPALLGNISKIRFLTDTRPYLMQMDNDEIYQNFTYFNVPVSTVGTFGLTGGLFSSQAYDEGKFGFQFGRSFFSGKIALGLGFSDYYINYRDLGKSKNALDGDLGISFHSGKILDVGLFLGNIYRADMAFDDDVSDKLPRIYGFGASLDFWKLIFCGDIKYEAYSNRDEIFLGLGAEYSINDYLALRSGLNNNFFSGGFGLKIYSKKWLLNYDEEKADNSDIKTLDISLDYALEYPMNFSFDQGNLSWGSSLESPYGDHYFGISVSYGKEKISEKEIREHFPFAIKTVADTVFVEIEKTKIDTVYKEKTVYDTITIEREVVDPNLIAQAIADGKNKVEEETTENVNLAAQHLTQALRKYYNQDYVGAIAECKTAIRIAPHFSLSYLRLGSIYYKLGDNEEALYYWQKAKEIDPENTEIDKTIEDMKKGIFKIGQ